MGHRSAVTPVVVSLKAIGRAEPEVQGHFGVTASNLFEEVRMQAAYGCPRDDALDSREHAAALPRVAQERLEERRETAAPHAIGRLHISEQWIGSKSASQ